MTDSEMVTGFKLEGVTTQDVCRAINAYLKQLGIEPEDRGFGTLDSTPLPKTKDTRWLVAFAVEGENEGYYIHIGALSRAAKGSWHVERTYTDFGHAKTYSADQAYAIATAAQRFLTAARWN